MTSWATSSDYALQWKCVRGITFQPVQDAGRNEDFDPSTDRFVLSDIRKAIIDAGTAFEAGDIIPAAVQPGIDCHRLCTAQRRQDRADHVLSSRRTCWWRHCPMPLPSRSIRICTRQILNFFSLATVECNNPERLDALLCCLPQVPVPEGMGYENIFRIAIVEFLDAAQFLHLPGEALLRAFRDAQQGRSFRLIPTICSIATQPRLSGAKCRWRRDESRHHDIRRVGDPFAGGCLVIVGNQAGFFILPLLAVVALNAGAILAVRSPTPLGGRFGAASGFSILVLACVLLFSRVIAMSGACWWPGSPPCRRSRAVPAIAIRTWKARPPAAPPER